MRGKITALTASALLLTGCATTAGYVPSSYQTLSDREFRKVVLSESQPSTYPIESPVASQNAPTAPVVVKVVPKPIPSNKPKIKVTRIAPKVTSKVTTGYISISAGRALAKAYAKAHVSASNYSCLVSLWNKESGWNYRDLNIYSGAYGIPQALPGSKMRSAGADWKTNPVTQVKWGLGYINGRYGSPCRAWRFWQSHRWY